MGARRGRRSADGAAAVEFALVMMPLVALVFGLIQYGLYFWAYQGGSDIARSASRVAAVDDVNTYTCDAFRSDIRDQINGLGDASTATITRTYVDTTAPAGVSVGDKVMVSVQFKSIDLHFPFVPFIRDGVVKSSSTARVDYVRDPDNPPLSCS
jgi:Flp pilus assembly protein TadG